MASLNYDLDGAEFPPIRMGTQVLYFDYDRIPYVAFIAWIHKEWHHEIERPFCNLATLSHIGKSVFRESVAPARYDDSIGKWKLTGRWAFVNEVPIEEYINTLPTYNLRNFRVDEEGKIIKGKAYHSSA